MIFIKFYAVDRTLSITRYGKTSYIYNVSIASMHRLTTWLANKGYYHDFDEDNLIETWEVY